MHRSAEALIPSSTFNFNHAIFRSNHICLNRCCGDVLRREYLSHRRNAGKPGEPYLPDDAVQTGSLAPSAATSALCNWRFERTLRHSFGSAFEEGRASGHQPWPAGVVGHQYDPRQRAIGPEAGRRRLAQYRAFLLYRVPDRWPLLQASFVPVSDGCLPGPRVGRADKDACRAGTARPIHGRNPARRPLVSFAAAILRACASLRNDAFGVFVRDLDQHHVARMALDKRCNIAVARPADQVALPVAWDRTIFNRRWSLACLLYTSPSPRDGLLSR